MSLESIAMAESAVMLESAVAVFAAIIGIVMVEFIVFAVLQLSLVRASSSISVQVLRISACYVLVKAIFFLFGWSKQSRWSAMKGPWQCVYLGGQWYGEGILH
jgi:hypothetical protein